MHGRTIEQAGSDAPTKQPYSTNEKIRSRTKKTEPPKRIDRIKVDGFSLVDMSSYCRLNASIIVLSQNH
jgi:hypothetical protein